MTVKYARQLAEQYAEEQQMYYMESVDLRDPAEMFASQEVYREAYYKRFDELVARYNLDLEAEVELELI